MELSQRRESSLQRRAAQALGASGANGLSTVPGNIGMVSGVSGGDLLAGLQPIGPPMSFSLGDFFEPVRGETKGEKNLEVKGNENPEVKRVVVADPKESESQTSDGAVGHASSSPQGGNGKGHGNQVATGQDNGGTQNVPRGSGNPRSADVEPVRKNPKGVSNVNVGRNEIPEMWDTMVMKNMLLLAKG